MNLNLITDEDAAKVVGAVRASHSSSADLATDAKKAAVGETPQVAADDVYSKLLKLVPIPIYAPYLTIESLLLSSVSSDDRLKILFVDLSAKQWACWATLVLFAALVPWYLARGGVVRARQLIVTTVGFMVLTTAAPGPWQLARWWHEYFATVALILMGVTLVFFFQKLNNLPDNAMSSITKVTQIPHGRAGG